MRIRDVIPLIFKEGLEADSVRKLADAVMNTCEGCCAVFSRNEDGSYKYSYPIYLHHQDEEEVVNTPSPVWLDPKATRK